MGLTRSRWLLQIALLATVACYFASAVVAARSTSGQPGWIDDALQTVVYVAAAALCAIRIPRDAPDRMAWRLVAVGLLSFALSKLHYLWFVRPRDPQPVLAAAHLLSWGFYACIFGALLLMLRTPAIRFPKRVALDGLVVGLGAATLTASVLMPQIATMYINEPRRSLVALTYPVADLVLVVLFAGGLCLYHWRPPPAFAWLFVGFVIFALADCVFVVRTALGIYQPGGPVDLLWVVAVTIIALAPGRAHSARAGSAPAVWLPLAAPLVAATVATAVLAAQNFITIHDSAVFLALCTIVAALCRLALAFLEARRATDYEVAAATDDLTGLLNRRGFHQRAATFVHHTSEGSEAFAHSALLLLDLDHFKDVNDSFGHTTGDELLQSVARRLEDTLGDEGVLARLGGDEFAVLLPGVDAKQAAQISAHLIEVISAPVDLDGAHVQTDVSVGVALSPDHCDDIRTMLRYADIAMYEAKLRQRGFHIFDHGIPQKLTSRAGMELLRQLRRAIENGELTVHYQPQVRLADEHLVGVEALVRWVHPERGLLYPDQFLPLARHSNLMQRLTDLVIDIALRDSARWRSHGYSVPIAINLPPAAFADVSLANRISAALRRHHAAPDRLAVDITEDVLMANRDRASVVLDQLQQIGIRVAIDDFGSGYTSLHHLRSLPIDEVKLDPSFTASLTTDPTSAAIVRSVIDLAHTLGMSTVAEGVETHDDAIALGRYGCDVVQGHYYSRPLDSAALLGWIANHGGHWSAARA